MAVDAAAVTDRPEPRPTRAVPVENAPPSRRIEGLDGLRALAVLAVLVYHLRPASLPGGFLGVDVFFVVSGFLITTLLLREVADRGRLDLTRFWVRRARRLLPALVAVVVLTVPVAWAASTDLLVGIGRQVLGALTFSTNWLEVAAGSSYFARTSPQLFVNFWSLAVEEQFYLLWPLVLAALLALTRTSRQRVRLTLTVAALSALAMAVLTTPGEDATRAYYGTDTHLFGLMIGAALAFAWAAPGRGFLGSPAWQRWRGPLTATAAAALLLLMLTLREDLTATFRGGILLASVLTAVLVAGLLDRPSAYRAALQAPVLEWVGRRSYGIYLWHWPVICILAALVPTADDSAGHWTVRGAAVVVTVVVAAGSFRWLEEPIRRHGFRSAGRAVVTALAGPGRRPVQVALGAVGVVVLLAGVAITQAPEKSATQLQIEAGQQRVA
ncbi:acyltransferase, partial [Georgenia sp. 10Sc9-8]|nr:acyltransferase [Georgenia halotolerans]